MSRLKPLPWRAKASDGGSAGAWIADLLLAQEHGQAAVATRRRLRDRGGDELRVLGHGQHRGERSRVALGRGHRPIAGDVADEDGERDCEGHDHEARRRRDHQHEPPSHGVAGGSSLIPTPRTVWR